MKHETRMTLYISFNDPKAKFCSHVFRSFPLTLMEPGLCSESDVIRTKFSLCNFNTKESD